MPILLWGGTTIAATWIIAWRIGTQAATAGAILMTLAALGVLVIYSILVRSQDRPSRIDR